LELAPEAGQSVQPACPELVVAWPFDEGLEEQMHNRDASADASTYLMGAAEHERRRLSLQGSF
jgi:hypothetical protein